MATLATATEKKMSPDEKHDRKPHRVRVDDKFKVFCGTANQPLADEVCAFLGMRRGQALVTRFADGEAYVQIQENVRGADVFVLQPTCRPVDQHLMELLLMMDALKRASARRITAVIPYYGYARQDRKDRPRAPIYKSQQTALPLGRRAGGVSPLRAGQCKNLAAPQGANAPRSPGLKTLRNG